MDCAGRAPPRSRPSAVYPRLIHLGKGNSALASSLSARRYKPGRFVCDYKACCQLAMLYGASGRLPPTQTSALCTSWKFISTTLCLAKSLNQYRDGASAVWLVYISVRQDIKS
ncbi:hypothetical protein NHX12_019619 [Muraenolepis orangiensis]|uniref:Uncharacterized protein n=1 Tax=Muraenolepis orangiensis TaxID=630683 RepID=A0A9Q0EU63_9TELE|nr:hypothetical protein NHX12_019619 [Muraenolepis orangiensis]